MSPSLVEGVEENMQEVVGHITEGVCRPLKVRRTINYQKHCPACLDGCSFVPCPHFVRLSQVRIEQVIVAEPGAVLLYKLSNLLKFYHHTIRYSFHSGAVIVVNESNKNAARHKTVINRYLKIEGSNVSSNTNHLPNLLLFHAERKKRQL